MIVADDHLPFVDVLAERLTERCDVRVLARCPAIVRAALEDGARGYLSKTSPWEEIFVAVRTVAEGQVWVSPLLQAGLNAQLAQPRRAPSERECEVLALAAEGLTDRQIAEHMYVSRETVRTNLKRCSEKLGVSGRTALVATALRQGILE